MADPNKKYGRIVRVSGPRKFLFDWEFNGLWWRLMVHCEVAAIDDIFVQRIDTRVYDGDDNDMANAQC